MSVSVIINTCAAAPHAMDVTGSHTPTPHAMRTYALQHFIIPTYIASFHVDEVIVVGEWFPGDGYTYLESPSEFRSAVDALAQRQLAFEASSGNLLVFQHDDHFLPPETLRLLRAVAERIPSDVWIPRRYRQTSDGVAELNNGFKDGYISGHAAMYTRDILEKAPWGNVTEVYTWDKEHTLDLQQAGASCMQIDDMKAYDIEVGDFKR